jgi:hypothetical protein
MTAEAPRLKMVDALTVAIEFRVQTVMILSSSLSVGHTVATKVQKDLVTTFELPEGHQQGERRLLAPLPGVAKQSCSRAIGGRERTIKARISLYQPQRRHHRRCRKLPGATACGQRHLPLHQQRRTSWKKSSKKKRPAHLHPHPCYC